MRPITYRIIRTTVTDRWSGQTDTQTVRVRWSPYPRRQTAILTREGERAAARAAGARGWLEDMTTWSARVLESGE